jgi:hypothetical protein
MLSAFVIGAIEELIEAKIGVTLALMSGLSVTTEHEESIINARIAILNSLSALFPSKEINAHE